MKQKASIEKATEKAVGQWKQQKAKEQAKEIAVDILCATLNSFTVLGSMVTSYNMMGKPSYITPDDILPKKKF